MVSCEDSRERYKPEEMGIGRRMCWWISRYESGRTKGKWVRMVKPKVVLVRVAGRWSRSWALVDIKLNPFAVA